MLADAKARWLTARALRTEPAASGDRVSSAAAAAPAGPLLSASACSCERLGSAVPGVGEDTPLACMPGA